MIQVYSDSRENFEDCVQCFESQALCRQSVNLLEFHASQVCRTSDDTYQCLDQTDLTGSDLSMTWVNIMRIFADSRLYNIFHMNIANEKVLTFVRTEAGTSHLLCEAGGVFRALHEFDMRKTRHHPKKFRIDH